MKPKDKDTIILMRHGHTDYLQGNTPVTIKEANDLNQQGINEVSSSSVEIADILKNSKKVTIYTSPLGRAIHTAKILEQHLLSDERDLSFFCAKELIEVYNFNWELFSEAVQCGKLEISKLPTDHWFAMDPFADKNSEILYILPTHLRDFALNMETASDARKRLENFIILTAETKGDKIYITHDGLLCSLVKELSENSLFTCTRSHYFELNFSKSTKRMKLGRNNLGY